MTVLIAGAGPVGLTTALLLARRGIPVTVLERRDRPNPVSRASTWHPPTLELFARLGLEDFVLTAGHRVTHTQYHATGSGLVAEFTLALLATDTPFPFRLHLEQGVVAAEMLRRLAAFPHVTVRFGCDVTAARQTSNGVRVQAGGTQHEGSLLVGCDGARSRVRDLLGLTFDGMDYPSRVLRVMTDADLPTLIPDLASNAYIFDGADSCSLLRMPDCWRVVFRVGPEESDADALDETSVRRRLARFLPPGAADLHLVSTDIYGASRRVASAFQVGRVLLAGDAAHVTNTRGGMNMNCGLHDADAAASAAADGSQAALEAYGALRRRVAVEQLVPRTDRTVSGGAAWLETVRARAADPAAARDFLRGTAMLDMAPRLSWGKQAA